MGQREGMCKGPEPTAHSRRGRAAGAEEGGAGAEEGGPSKKDPGRGVEEAAAAVCSSLAPQGPVRQGLGQAHLLQHTAWRLILLL